MIVKRGEKSHTAMRSDAFANVSRIVAAARQVFATGDGDSLNHIAKVAGVGIATLYRHFPNRESLARAAYDDIFTTEVEPLIAEFARTDAPRDALLNVAERLYEIILREKGLVASLGNVTEETTALLAGCAETLTPLLRKAQEAGNVRADLDPEDLPYLIAMIVAALSAVAVDGDRRRRYLGFLLDALKPPVH
ncbi:TetR/AcrR family transcriptional regulator [Actinoplanes sp. NPDC026670]|uniref:TetR/AcrR family transcriptional regulator n=1 Tax=Actinoplanes sp. NPDC026670 TaxID=3154700 RepID=UPI00340F1F66